MDANRFDALARNVGTPTSRRAALAGSVLGALGLSRAAPVAHAAQRATCTIAFTANVRSGPNATRPLTQGAQPGQLQAQIRFTLSDTGNIENGELLLPNNTSVPVVGQATGLSLQLRAAIGPELTLVAVGVGEQAIADCQGTMDGLVTGPATGDLGDWHAVALQQGQGGTRKNDKNDKNDRKNQAAEQTTATATAVSQGRGNTATGSDAIARSCSRGQTFCNLEEGYCADLMVDPLNCGACGNLCAVNNCTGGICGEATASIQNCGAPFALCPDGCVNLETNARNCGACGNLCLGSTCTGGVCDVTADSQRLEDCAPPRAMCNGQCIDLSGDDFNCGACDVICLVGQGCSNGECATPQLVCQDGLTECNGTCIDTTSDSRNCGGCGIVCGSDQVCVNSACTGAGATGQTVPQSTCAEGLTDCGGTCIDLLADDLNCNACGNRCLLGEHCILGTCTPDCNPGWIKCDGVTCVDLQNDPSHCGACYNACPSGQCGIGICVEIVGGATPTCTPGTTRCGNACVDLMTDIYNCGACSLVCPGIEPDKDDIFCEEGLCYSTPL